MTTGLHPSGLSAPAASSAARVGRWTAIEGSPLPLGVTYLADEKAFNFAIYSKHAERMTLLLFGDRDPATPVLARELDHRHHKSGRVWHCRLPDDELEGARYYAYSVDGPPPAGPFEWHAFDPEKILLDPYSRAVWFPPGFDRAAATRPGSNAGRAPLGVLRVEESEPRARPRVQRHEADAVIYELHVRNFQRHESSGVAPASRGTYAGVIEKIPYLVELGVTVVELMPVFECDPQGADCWGYMPLSFMAPNSRYAGDTPRADARREFREMVDALHRAGIEVVIDVVYNHTCEGDGAGPTYGLKGIDNSTYYLMTGEQHAPYADFSGGGNTLHCANHTVRKLIVDSMRHWVADMGVDGFRFDLASIFARGRDGQLRFGEAAIIAEITGHEDLAHLRLIAEPWDAGGANQLGRTFPGSTWHQWNAAFRDDVRRFMRGDPGMVAPLMRRLYGSDDLFPDDRANAYRPMQSVNYVSSHDGPTLYDLVAYNHKHNWANGHDNRDGPADSFSWNCGWEGDEHLPGDVRRLRLHQARNQVLLTLLANGTPMLRAGDEFLHTQRGNDNPYNQDDPTVWLDWDRRNAYPEMVRFTRLAIDFRKRHPSLARSRFWHDDVRWYGVGLHPDLGHDSHSLAFCLHGAAEDDDDIYVMINAWQEALLFEIQEGRPGEWLRVADTALPPPDDMAEPGHEIPVPSMRYHVDPHSVVVCRRRPHAVRCAGA